MLAKRKESRAVEKTRKCRSASPSFNGETLRSAVSWAADGKIFDHLELHGNTNWSMGELIQLTILWVWADHSTLTGAFQEAQHWWNRVVGRTVVDSYQGLLKALVKWTSIVLPLLQDRLHGLMRVHGAPHWRVGPWVALAVDGSRVSVPRTHSNEQAFCAPHFGKGKHARYNQRQRNKQGRKEMQKNVQPLKPQIWVTLLWHMGLQMPWSWRTGRSNSSERAHFRQMLTEEKFPENTLFCADAGFVGYDLWNAILDEGHSFLIRVGANVTLLRGLGYCRERDGIVYFWPKKALCKQAPPLVLRLLQFRLGQTNVYLVTNVLSTKRLNDTQARRLYEFRWGVELQFRSLKQTFGRRQLRCRSAERAYVELDWSLVGLWIIQLFAVKEQIHIGEIPEHCSVSLAIQVVRRTFQRWSEQPDRTYSFAVQLRSAVKDEYQRSTSKRARYQPNYKDKPAAGKPKIIPANQHHKLRLIRYLNAAA